VGERASARREDLVGRGSRTSDKSSQRLWFVRTDRWAMSACAPSRWSQDVAISKRDTEMKGAPDQPRERNLHLGLIAARHMFRRCPRLVITRQGRCENVWVLREPRPTKSAHSPFRPIAVSPLLEPLHSSPLLDLDLILHFCRRAESLEETEFAGAGCGYLE
jgi:hypothetical protein